MANSKKGGRYLNSAFAVPSSPHTLTNGPDQVHPQSGSRAVTSYGKSRWHADRPLVLKMPSRFHSLLITAFLATFIGLQSGVLSKPIDPHQPVPRDVRVLVASDVQRIRIRADQPLLVGRDRKGPPSVLDVADWFVFSLHPSGEIQVSRDGRAASRVRVWTEQSGAIDLSVHDNGAWLPAVRYPGSLTLTTDKGGSFDVVNHVEIETYVACVVAREVWPTFDTEAYRAQAIVSRTFLLYQMKRRSKSAYDLTATQRSQVYRGIRADSTGRRAAKATDYTRGIALTWRDQGEDRLFCAYYSGACGGMSQPATIFGTEGDIEPLSGNVPCDYCKDAPGDTYRWGPVTLSKDKLWHRLILSYPDLASLKRLRSIEVIERTSSGRPTKLRIAGSGGKSHDMLAERFRLTIGGTLLRSTDFRIRQRGSEVVFENGRGFGHGLGLCQWGMQGQAHLGKKAGEILTYYYPGARLTRVY